MSEINLTISRLSTCFEEIQYTVEGGGWLSRWQSTIVTWWYVPSIKKDAKNLCNKHMLPNFKNFFTTELLSMAIFWFDNDSSEHCGRSEIEWDLWWRMGVEIHHNHNIVKPNRYSSLTPSTDQLYQLTFYAENYFVALRPPLPVLSPASVRTVVLLTNALFARYHDDNENDESSWWYDDMSTWITRDWLDRRMPPVPLEFGCSRSS